MKFREMIKKVQLNSGFSDAESKDALEHMVEALAIRLNEGERKDFASQLPTHLQRIALSVYPTEYYLDKDLIDDFMELQGIDEAHAKKQIHATWAVLKEAVSEGEIKHIRAQLPSEMVAMLH